MIEVDCPDRTKQFARRIIRLYCALPKANTVSAGFGKAGFTIGDVSGGENYREAHRGRSKAEFVSKIGDFLEKKRMKLSIG